MDEKRTGWGPFSKKTIYRKMTVFQRRRDGIHSNFAVVPDFEGAPRGTDFRSHSFLHLLASFGIFFGHSTTITRFIHEAVGSPS
jgi:hypothetical protein